MLEQQFPRVFIVTVNYNTKQDTVECLDSLEKLTYPNYHVVVVDNDSADNELFEIETRTNVTLIRNERNLGVGGGYNVGIRHALAHGADYVLLLNNDTTVEPNLIDELLKPFDEHSNIGIVAPWITFYDHPRLIWFAAGRYYQWLGVPSHPYLHFDVDQVPLQSGYSDFVTVCAAMIKREVFEKAGLWNEDLFLYGDDPEFCLRARRAGYRSYVVGRVLVYHKSQASSGGRGTIRLSPISSYYHSRGLLYSFFLVTPSKVKRAVGTLFHWLVFFPYQMWRSRNSKAVIPYILGLCDAMRGKLGPWESHMRRDGRTPDGRKIRVTEEITK